jgi:hypothetical protein
VVIVSLILISGYLRKLWISVYQNQFALYINFVYLLLLFSGQYNLLWFWVIREFFLLLFSLSFVFMFINIFLVVFIFAKFFIVVDLYRSHFFFPWLFWVLKSMVNLTRLWFWLFEINYLKNWKEDHKRLKAKRLAYYREKLELNEIRVEWHHIECQHVRKCVYIYILLLTWNFKFQQCLPKTDHHLRKRGETCFLCYVLYINNLRGLSEIW